MNARRDERADHGWRKWCGRATSRKTGANGSGVCREEGPDPPVAPRSQAERFVRAVRYEPAQGHGKVQPAQGESGGDEKPDAPTWARRFVAEFSSQFPFLISQWVRRN